MPQRGRLSERGLAQGVLRSRLEESPAAVARKMTTNGRVTAMAAGRDRPDKLRGGLYDDGVLTRGGGAASNFLPIFRGRYYCNTRTRPAKH